MKKLILYMFATAFATVSFSERFDNVRFSQEIVVSESDPMFSTWNGTSPQWLNDLERLEEYYVSLSVNCIAGNGRQRSVFASSDGTSWKRVCNFYD